MAKPSLALIPSGYANNKVFSVLPSNGDGDFDFTRGSAATRVNSQGLIETVSSNAPRLNYPLLDGVVQECPSLFLEPSRTNFISYSEDFSQWSSNGGGVTSNQTISPNGTLNADKLFAQTNNGQHRVDFSSSNASGATTFSFFAKSAEYNSVWARIGLSTSFFNLENGESHNNTTETTSSMKYYGNGWYRCIITKEISSANEVCRINLTQSYIDSSVWTGDGTSGLYVWGAMHEFGSYATSYIPTNGQANGVTRLAETCNGAGTSDTFNDSEGVLMAEFSNISENNNTTVSIALSDGTVNNSVSLYYFGTSGVYYDIFNSDGTRSGSAPMTKIQQTYNNKIALKYKSGDIALWINGIKLNTNNATLNLSNLSEVNLNYGNGGFPFYGNTKQLQYFDTALTDSELEQLTSWVSFSDMANGQLYTIE